jgi:hypothetical protein
MPASLLEKHIATLRKDVLVEMDGRVVQPRKAILGTRSNGICRPPNDSDSAECLKRLMIDGDEIWRFSTPPWTWKMLAGRAGLVIVRSGRVIHGVTTIIS